MVCILFNLSMSRSRCDQNLKTLSREGINRQAVSLANIESVHSLGRYTYIPWIQVVKYTFPVALPGGCLWVHMHTVSTPVHPLLKLYFLLPIAHNR